MNRHHISLAVDDDILAEQEQLRRCTIARVSKIRALIDHRRFMTAVAEEHDQKLDWKVEVYDDWSYLIHCPSTDIARTLDSRGEISFPEFTATFEPWSSDTEATGKAVGELRWVHGRGLPLCFRRRNILLKLLKPVGKMVHLGSREGLRATYFRAMLRLRRGQKLPTMIDCCLFRQQYLIELEMVDGQPPLPWEQAKQEEGNKVKETTTIAGDREEEERRRKGKEKMGLLGKDRCTVDRREETGGYGATTEHATPCDAAPRVRIDSREPTTRRTGPMKGVVAGPTHGPDHKMGHRVERHLSSDGQVNTLEWRAKQNQK
ncbi:hypothetical protein J5N97_011075 [Dioscorea zingiberensis]|uniref:Uncharacterized protein n=1 Tax=Dioscorea zingiberensis TaxID=325984 RepID=A0A9D5CZM5_9LILI|nr:hypothetical protein J5N97_011075 [Dioscorea zingiberensis]